MIAGQLTALNDKAVPEQAGTIDQIIAGIQAQQTADVVRRQQEQEIRM